MNWDISTLKIIGDNINSSPHCGHILLRGQYKAMEYYNTELMSTENMKQGNLAVTSDNMNVQRKKNSGLARN